MNYLPIKLEKLRKHYNYSQANLASVLGVDVMDYMGFENGRKMLNYEQMKKLASFYHIDLIEIFRNSEEVTLHESGRSDTDTINIEYFIPKKTLLTLIKEHPLLSGGIFGLIVSVVVISLLVISNNKSRPYVSYADNTDRLAVSHTSLVYIDNLGAVKGAGDNSNGQISNLPSEKATKVQEGEDFTAVLLDDGTVLTTGLKNEDQNKVNKWNNIVDIAAGAKHLVAVDNKGEVYAVGENDKGQIDTNNFDNVKNVYAAAYGTIVLTDKGEIQYTGQFIGTSLLNKYSDIKDVETSEENIIILKEDGTCDYMASYDDPCYYNVTVWKNIVDVTCGDDYFAGLKEDGTIVIASKTYSDKDVANLMNIIAIDGVKEYLIAFDGENIYGLGDNTYHQFEKEESDKELLDSVTGIVVDYDANEVVVRFNDVEHATGYKVTLYIGENNKVEKEIKKGEKAIFTTEGLEDNNLYKVEVISLGDDEYQDSNPSRTDFIYLKEVEESTNKITIRNDVVGSNREDFEEYLRSVGVVNIGSSVNENSPCESGEEVVLEISGITPGSTYSEGELKARNVVYTYCKLNLDD